MCEHAEASDDRGFRSIKDRIAILRDGEIIQLGTSQDIVLRPADHYIASFVKEVNRGRVIQIDAVMRAATSDAGTTALAVVTGTTLGEAAKILTDAKAAELSVVDASGQVIGFASLNGPISAIVAPERETAQTSIRKPDIVCAIARWQTPRYDPPSGFIACNSVAGYFANKKVGSWHGVDLSRTSAFLRGAELYTVKFRDRLWPDANLSEFLKPDLRAVGLAPSSAASVACWPEAALHPYQ